MSQQVPLTISPRLPEDLGSILAIDIGNSRIKFAVVSKAGVIAFTAMPSKGTPSELTTFFEHTCQSALDPFYPSLKAVVISSVVPHNNDLITEMLKGKVKAPVNIIARELDLGLQLGESTSKSGLDIICKSSYLASLGQPTLCLDSGTATVIHYVNVDGLLAGAAITLGYLGLYKSLHTEAELLPLYEPSTAEVLLGTNTESAVKGGCFFGYARLLEGLVAQAQLETECEHVYFTGGFAAMFAPKVGFPHHLDPYLVVKGIFRIYSLNQAYFLTEHN